MKLAKAAYGRDLTEDEMNNFDPENLVGKQVDVMVEQNPSDDGTVIYNNIVSFAKALKKLEPVDASEMGTQTAIERSTVPANAPDTEKPDEFIDGLEKERAAAKGEAEEEDEEAELERKLAEAKAKKAAAAKAKA